MGLPKGRTNNKKGKPKGIKNKTTEEIRLSIQYFIDKNIRSMQTDFEAMEPKDRLTFIDRLLKHVLPSPLHELERLTDEQLDELITRLKSKKDE